MASFFQGTDPDIDPGNAQESAILAEAWATKMDGPVQDNSYSAQYNATEANSSALQAASSADAAAASADAAAASAAELNSLALDDLLDVNAPSPTEGDVLTFTGGQWVAAPAAAAAGARRNLVNRLARIEAALEAAGVEL